MILVTGATGFIGRRLMKRLVETYDRNQILCLVYPKADTDLERTGRALLAELGIQSIPVDLTTGAGLELAPSSPEILLHLASNTDTGSVDHRINDIGTKLLLEAVRPRKVVFTSTISVSDHRTFPNQPGDESSELLRPRSEYGRRKLQTEAYLKAQAKERNFSLSILRVSATYGSGTRAKGLYDSLVALAKQDSLLARINYPGQMTSMHVDDVADILVKLSQLPEDAGNPKTFLAEAETLSIHEMCAGIYHALKKPFRPIVLPSWFWWIAQKISLLIYAAEPVLPHGIYNKLWQLTLLVNNGYNNVSIRLKQTFPEKAFKRFQDTAQDLLA